MKLSVRSGWRKMQMFYRNFKVLPPSTSDTHLSCKAALTGWKLNNSTANNIGSNTDKESSLIQKWGVRHH